MNGPRPDMDFTPVRNGMDYLTSAVLQYLVPPPHVRTRPIDDRELKYAVLHLQAATEVLLKARLVREHWSLVFKDPGKATRLAFEQGKFESCDMNATMDRLTEIANVPITPKQRAAIKALAETRNALTHYGHTANAYAVEARAVAVLNFLLDFVPLQLHPVLSSEAEFVKETMESVGFQVRRIESLVKMRMQELTKELQGLEERTVICPECRQWAMVVGADPVACRFCLASWEPNAAALQYWDDVLKGEFEALATDPCGCGDDLVLLVNTAADKSEDVGLCFACGTLYERKV
ncbi:hypothetical protein ACFYZ0_18240 [Streptomyces sp. NPDC001708]|uniref:hypothetical protein n=1 Tax=Streptomyces sp. NPDC001708 TaxID=3364602 RepID=UPI00369A8687